MYVMESELYNNVNNPLCIKACDVNKTTVLTIFDTNYYKFIFHVSTEVTNQGRNILKDTSELIDWLNKTPTKEFYIVDFQRTWAIYLCQDDAMLCRIRWGGEVHE